MGPEKTLRELSVLSYSPAMELYETGGARTSNCTRRCPRSWEDCRALACLSPLLLGQVRYKGPTNSWSSLTLANTLFSGKSTQAAKSHTLRGCTTRPEFLSLRWSSLMMRIGIS
uniref:Uncharacterized protein n=1 Tax=Mus musculus TaxID=10090 RepID=Q9CQQ9_MOUSE|nr:unnamed protein product [Mus musculus]BAB25949.1 unnamed protein product [Mus musculus]